MTTNASLVRGVLAFSLVVGTTDPLWAQRGAPADAGLRAGDRILLEVRAESLLTDTFTVAPGPSLVLPQVGPISLAGVTRDHLERHLAAQLARVLHHPVVRARVLLRIGVVGEVARPGFYDVSGATPLSDALMAAGGPTREAKIKKLRIERVGRPVLEGSALARALSAGSTLDQLELRSGDRIVVPGEGRGFDRTVRVLTLLITIPAAVFGLSQVF